MLLNLIEILLNYSFKICYLILYVHFTSVPTGAPQDITLIDITITSAIISWDPPDISLQNGMITNYKLILSKDTTEVVEVYSTKRVKKFINLIQNTNYRVDIAAGTSIGYGPYGNYSFITETGTLLSITYDT